MVGYSILVVLVVQCECKQSASLSDFPSKAACPAGQQAGNEQVVGFNAVGDFASEECWSKREARGRRELCFCFVETELRSGET